MEIPRIAVAEVVERLGRGEPVTFVDARSAQAYGDADEQLPGSVRIPPDADVAQLSAHLPRERLIVTYCT